MASRELDAAKMTLSKTTSSYHQVFSQVPVVEADRKKISVCLKKHTVDVEILSRRHATFLQGLAHANAGEVCASRRFGFSLFYRQSWSFDCCLSCKSVSCFMFFNAAEGGTSARICTPEI